jgi:hypothetical protein
MFNVLNNSNQTAWMQTIFNAQGLTASTFGKPQSPTASQSRIIQLGLRLVF